MFRWFSSLPLVTRLFSFWKKYEHFFGSAALTVGFCFDLIFANRPDSVANNLLLLGYLLVAGGLIVALSVHKTRQMERENPADPMLLLLVLQFLFGNLSSNLLVLYGRSGTLAGSAIFVGLLLVMLVGNEFLKTRYDQLRFNIAVYYLLVFSYLMIAVPTFVLHDIGTLVFLAAGAISLAFIGAFLWIVHAVVLRGKYRRRHLVEVALYVAAIYAVFNIFYFLNIIPPVPLSLKEIGIYHGVTRTSAGEYQGSFESPAWYQFWRRTSAEYHIDPKKPAYCFSSVFAPTGLSTPIIHTWEHYNETTRVWDWRGNVTFPISGGRSGGYRGFSTKIIEEGKWRCDVITQNGQLIGRTSFVAESGSATDVASQTL